MRSLLHKSTFFGFGIIFLISGCSITSTSYEGFMTFPQNIMFDSANFKYVKTISGSSAAIYSAYGYDKLRVPEGLINSAKSEMYGTHTFMPNQIITNISRDIIRTHSGKGVTSSFSVKVIMSADIYEFSNDGIYSSDKNVSNENFDLTEENIKSSTNDIEIKKINHVKLLQLVLDESGYSAMLKNKKDIENENRLENIKELLSAMKEFENLETFLEHVALATSIDQDWDGEKVNMMTMHGSKGLEFDVVFLPGWEEGLFPHQKSIEEKGQNGLEEERRLAYVGITRAKKKALVSFAMNRFYQGNWIDSMASRFVDELPEKFLEKNSFFDESKEDDNDFEFNQDFEIDEGKKSPGWIRYQKRIK